MSIVKKLKNQSVVVAVLENVTDFSKYERLETVNRAVAQVHVNQLMESFVKFGTGSVVIRVLETKAFGKKRYFVADGQHSIDALTPLEMGATVIVVKLLEDTPIQVSKYIATLNNSNKAWGTSSFVKAYCNDDVHVREYDLFNEMKKVHNLTVTDLEYIFMVKHNEFKSGEMTFIDEEDGLKLLNAIVKIKPIYKKAYVRRSLIKLFRASKDYNKFADALVKENIKYPEDEQQAYAEAKIVFERVFRKKADKVS